MQRGNWVKKNLHETYYKIVIICPSSKCFKYTFLGTKYLFRPRLRFKFISLLVWANTGKIHLAYLLVYIDISHAIIRDYNGNRAIPTLANYLAQALISSATTEGLKPVHVRLTLSLGPSSIEPARHPVHQGIHARIAHMEETLTNEQPTSRRHEHTNSPH